MGCQTVSHTEDDSVGVTFERGSPDSHTVYQVEVLLCVSSAVSCSQDSELSLVDDVIRALSVCQPLQPLAEHVWIICSSSTHPLLMSSSQLSHVASSRIISVQNGISELTGYINAFAETSASRHLNAQSSLVVIDCASLCNWTTNLQRFLTHSLLRSEICIAHTRGTSWVGPPNLRAALTLEDASYNARVADIQQSSGPQQTSTKEALLCPLLCIPAQHWTKLFNAASQTSTFTEMMQALLQAAAVYSLPIDGCLWATGPEDDQLLQAYKTIAQAIKRTTIPTKPSSVVSSMPSPQQAALESLSALLASGPAVDLRAISNPSGNVREPPAVHLAAQQHQPKRQHPVYLTSNNVYGSKAPSLHELPLSWHGIRGDFTRKQATGKVVTTGLKTAISNHAVSDTLHEIGL